MDMRERIEAAIAADEAALRAQLEPDLPARRSDFRCLNRLCAGTCVFDERVIDDRWLKDFFECDQCGSRHYTLRRLPQ